MLRIMAGRVEPRALFCAPVAVWLSMIGPAGLGWPRVPPSRGLSGIFCAVGHEGEKRGFLQSDQVAPCPGVPFVHRVRSQSNGQERPIHARRPSTGAG